MELYTLRAFTDVPNGGNPAGVVLLEDAFPNDEYMLSVAKQLGYSETAFVLRYGDTFRLRYFTPASEIELCGHATIAAFYLMRTLGLKDGEYRARTLAGKLGITVGETIYMDMAAPELIRTIDSPAELEELRSVMGASRLPRLPLPMIVSTGLKDIILPVHDMEALSALRPDFPALSKLSALWGVVGVHAYCLGESCTAHCRNFAPLYDIDEESATGTASGALTHYLALNGVITAPAGCVFRQGELMGSPSEICATLTAGGIRVGGRAVVTGVNNL